MACNLYPNILFMNTFYISSIGKIMNKQKTLYSSVAVATLGLFCINSQVVQADKLPENQVTNSTLTKKVVNPKSNSTLASTKTNNDAVSADYLNNKPNRKLPICRQCLRIAQN